MALLRSAYLNLGKRDVLNALIVAAGIFVLQLVLAVAQPMLDIVQGNPVDAWASLIQGLDFPTYVQWAWKCAVVYLSKNLFENESGGFGRMR